VTSPRWVSPGIPKWEAKIWRRGIGIFVAISFRQVPYNQCLVELFDPDLLRSASSSPLPEHAAVLLRSRTLTAEADSPQRIHPRFSLLTNHDSPSPNSVNSAAQIGHVRQLNLQRAAVIAQLQLDQFRWTDVAHLPFAARNHARRLHHVVALEILALRLQIT
jgi:hypothetical protein